MLNFLKSFLAAIKKFKKYFFRPKIFLFPRSLLRIILTWFARQFRALLLVWFELFEDELVPVSILVQSHPGVLGDVDCTRLPRGLHVIGDEHVIRQDIELQKNNTNHFTLWKIGEESSAPFPKPLTMEKTRVKSNGYSLRSLRKCSLSGCVDSL